MPAWLSLILGLAALLVGAELVVRFGSSIAQRLGIPPIVVGLTIVSIGTSAPELAVGIEAISDDAGSLAVGNIAGTNVVNLLLILGLAAVMRPVLLARQTLVLDLPAMVGASVLLLALAWDGSLSVLDGVVLFAGALVYTGLLLWNTRRERMLGRASALLEEFAAETDDVPDVMEPAFWPVTWRLGGLIAALMIIVLGADWLVTGAVEIAQAFGVSDAFIGLTVVAIGTSAPELVTTIVSTLRGERDIAIGNLIGSSTYNLTLVLGASLFFADGQVALDPELVMVDIPIMVLVALVCIPVFLTGRRITRTEGVVFIGAYAVFLGYLILNRT